MSRPRNLGKGLREASAILTQARLMSNSGPNSRVGSGPTVVLLHGLYASAGVWRPIRERLEQAFDASTYSFSYSPGPGVLELTERVKNLVEQIDGAAPIVLVGHSLGGLVMRAYASGKECDRRVVRTISLASPYLGSSRNWLVPGQAGRDIAPESPLLVRLRESNADNQRLPHLSLVAEEDEMILPGAYPEYGAHRLISRVGHNGILFSEETIECVVREVRKVAEATKT